MRRGFGTLATVCMLAFAAGLIVLSYHTLWRGSSRALFSVQEHRQLANLSRSAISEAVYTVQTKLEQGDSYWIDWCTVGPDVEDDALQPKFTQEYSSGMTADPRFLKYTVSGVTVKRVHGLSLFSAMSGGTGTVDFSVTVSVVRHSPNHFAKITFTERRAVALTDVTSPFSRAGRHIEFLATPVASFMEFQ